MQLDADIAAFNVGPERGLGLMGLVDFDAVHPGRDNRGVAAFKPYPKRVPLPRPVRVRDGRIAPRAHGRTELAYQLATTRVWLGIVDVDLESVAAFRRTEKE